ncbi:MAG: sulfate adenylyltransferase subunit CysN [Bacteroidales bacterium]|jgi:adenylyl-sulfate kinase|nr:sulfate adenylyltransferase subunit CysN [Bacteroidales bacterium]MDD3700854.1 sulfate adenylyltransferase subunit CysN [Bacteroidales bacterium]MDY0369439.1 sulfate adenylyltransferase subunit CysN [Bacteroidales bacterium]
MQKTTSKLDITQFLDQDQQKDLLRFLTAGSVDDGKSTLIGKLLFDSKKIYEDQLAALESDSKRIGHAGSETDYALLLDGLQAEREQGITIDVAYRYFSTNKRKFIIADTPGHEQYTRNMVTGASTANLAIILIDARKGVITQTKRHTFLVSLLGIKHIVLAVNKMDLVEYEEDVFNKICDDYKKFVTRLNIPDVYSIPLSALKGDNVVDNSAMMPWYKGKSLLTFLESVHIGSDRNFEDFRLPVQHVLRPDIHFRGFSGKIASGILREGDEILALPSRKTSHVTRIIGAEGDVSYAFPPQSVTITLADEIDISRGDMLVHPHHQPRIERQFEAMLVWMDEQKMDPYAQFFIKHNTQTTRVRLDQIRYRVDVNTLEHHSSEALSLNEIARVVLTTNKPLFFDPYHRNRNTGSFILIDPITHNTCAVGMIMDKLNPDDLHSRIIDTEQIAMIHRGKSLIKPEAIRKRYNQVGATLWITGLHGSGKNVLAYTLEKELFDRGATVVMLDGSTIRSGLTNELDFTPAGRAEQIRRVAHVCRILNDQGVLVICSFITSQEHIRKQIAQLIGDERFHLIYMDVDIDYCRKNKPELYELADQGKLKFLPGIDLQYEVPLKPALICRPEQTAENLEAIMQYLQLHTIFPLE